MARVPVVAGNVERLAPLPGGQFRPVDTTGGLSEVSSAFAGASHTANVASDEQLKIDEALDKAAVKQADTVVAQRLRERLYTGDNAFYNKEGFNAVNDRPVVEKEINAMRDEVGATLTTERQRTVFGQVFQQRADSELTGIARYAGQQVKAEEKKQSLARISTAADDAVLHWDDPTALATNVNTALSEVRGMAADGGWAPEVLQRAEREQRSTIYSRAVQGAIDRGDIEKAHAFLETNRDQILPTQSAALDLALKGPLLDRQAEGVVDMLLGTAPAPAAVAATANDAGAVLPRMVSITTHTESKGHDLNPSGGVLTSPKGAQGRMQVMPTTNTDPGFGVRPAADNGLEERARVGRDYLAAMMKRYGNDPGKAWAAYNWGPGNLDAALKKYGDTWIDHAPGETQAYVRGNLAALGGRGDNPPTQQQPQTHDLNQLLTRMDALNLPFDLEQKVRARLTGRVTLDETLLQRKQEASVQDAWGTVEKLGTKFTNVNQLPVAALAGMTAQQRVHFEAIAEQNTKANRPQTDWGAYSNYSNLYARDPASFAKLSPAELRAHLSDGDFQQVLGWQRDAITTVGRQPTEHQVTHDRVLGILNPLLEQAGILKPVAKGRHGVKPEDVSAYATRVGKAQRAVSNDVELWQQRNPGKQITDTDIQAIADRQMLTMWHAGQPGAVRAFERPPELGEKGWTFAMPNVERDRIRDAYRRRWNRDPSPGEVANIYLYGPRGGQ